VTTIFNKGKQQAPAPKKSVATAAKGQAPGTVQPSPPRSGAPKTDPKANVSAEQPDKAIAEAAKGDMGPLPFETGGAVVGGPSSSTGQNGTYSTSKTTSGKRTR
jgi:hypothetical protein